MLWTTLSVHVSGPFFSISPAVLDSTMRLLFRLSFKQRCTFGVQRNNGPSGSCSQEKRVVDPRPLASVAPSTPALSYPRPSSEWEELIWLRGSVSQSFCSSFYPHSRHPGAQIPSPEALSIFCGPVLRGWATLPLCKNLGLRRHQGAVFFCGECG